ncbi:chorismate synthase [Candidatus Gottesmanbacteria bacterium RIFCSPHIGHO2_02_FULL_39_14]|uniref:Chorismate synthase n=1 Tax=Candidatus Gottesmanbacteria bacterium RIFCSPHIGHO2_02_FULL_39_14 TaxID=1798383 RepID=A0A1F6A2U3_9BACT|nr:MAG: chorismate synthase [Candidatus Gottesmanbacteria bacterium RIFCSPHIGHO2_02_FULL_39_14]
MLRFLTAGESHGQAELAILEGIPVGLSVTEEIIQKDLDKRRGGAGRGGRGLIEKDKVKILSGVRLGKTIGSPIALLVENSDFQNWKVTMSVHPPSEQTSHLREVSNPRPGHADLAGALKYGFSDIRNVIERSSARETIMRVAIGSICRRFLSEFNIQIDSRIIRIGKMEIPDNSQIEEIIIRALKKKDTLGGVIQIIARNVPPGLGSYVHWDRKLDGLIARALMSIPSVKAVEIGDGITNAGKFGSQVHDEIYYDEKYLRKTNHAGGLEGGVTNGEDIVCRVYHKPLSTLGNPFNTINLQTKKSVKAVVERSDICVVPRAGVISEAMIAFVLSDVLLEKFGSDNLNDIKKNYQNYLRRIKI